MAVEMIRISPVRDGDRELIQRHLWAVGAVVCTEMRWSLRALTSGRMLQLPTYILCRRPMLGIPITPRDRSNTTEMESAGF